MKNDEKTELIEVLDHYDLGELVDYERITRGYVNTSYAILTRLEGSQKQYFLRKYKQGINKDEIQFEHSIIKRLQETKICPVAPIYSSREGKTYLHQIGEIGDAYYAIFDYLPGEDRYTWVNPNCNDAELANAAVTLAQFHQAMNHFTPYGKRFEPKIVELISDIHEYVIACTRNSKQTIFDKYLIETLPLVLESLQQIRAIINEPEVQKLQQLIIHCDFHPGNLKYEGDRIVGLFDFDWSKEDARCFDVGLALWYFCTKWESDKDGVLRLDQVDIFLRNYQNWLVERSGLGPLNPMEGKYLPYMISAGSLYVYYWTILDYYHKEVDPVEYLMYLKHCVNFFQWFGIPRNLAELKALAESLT